MQEFVTVSINLAFFLTEKKRCFSFEQMLFSRMAGVFVFGGDGGMNYGSIRTSY